MVTPSPAEAEHAAISTDVGPVTQAELLGYLKHARFEKPSWVDGRSWQPAVEATRDILRGKLDDLSLPVSHNRVEMARQVCHPIDVQLTERGVKVAETRKRLQPVVRLLERWLTLRLRLQTAKQYPALVKLAAASEGTLYLAQIKKNRPTCDMVDTMEKVVTEFKVAEDEEAQIAWQLIGEHLAHAAGLKKLTLSHEEPPGEAMDEEGDDDEVDKSREDDEGDNGDDGKRRGPKRAPKKKVLGRPNLEVQLRRIEGTDRYAADGSWEVEALIDPLNSVAALRAKKDQLVYGVITRENLDLVRRSRAKRATAIQVGDFFAFRVSLPEDGPGVLLDPTANLAANPFLVKHDGVAIGLHLFADIKLRTSSGQAEMLARIKEAQMRVAREALLARIRARKGPKSALGEPPAEGGENEDEKVA